MFLQNIYNSPISPSNLEKTIPEALEDSNSSQKKFGNDFRFKNKAEVSEGANTEEQEQEQENSKLSNEFMAKKIQQEGWLRVSSYAFKNSQRFPNIPLPDGTSTQIPLAKGNFRINESYKKGAKTSGPTNQYFWFRLSGKYIYYTPNKANLNVLGTVLVQKIRGVENLNDKNYCFKIIDIDNQKWKFCAKDKKTVMKWICMVQAALKMKKSASCKDPKKFTPAMMAKQKIIKRTITQPYIVIPIAQRHCNSKWNYRKKGTDWECLCKDGKEQSPIDLPKPLDAIASPAKPLFEYENVDHLLTESRSDGLAKAGQSMRIQHHNKVLKIFHTNFGKVVTMDGAVYQAHEIHFHTPSEHTVNGQHFPLEMQIVHKARTKGDFGKNLVLSFVFKPKAGVYNKFIDKIEFFNLPNPVDKYREITNNIYIPNILLNSDDEDVSIMNPFSFFTYQGSLSQPPCVEKTIHYIASKPISLGITALELFKEALRKPDMEDPNGNIILAKNQYLKNNRGTQALNGRAVFHYDHTKYNCPVFKRKINGGIEGYAGKGHYEKREKEIVNYIFVEGNKPSGMPNAFVVDEKEAKGK